MTALNGDDLRRAFDAATRSLERHRDSINSLNVFPVPDGDTGTNMLLTMRSALERCPPANEATAGEVTGPPAAASVITATMETSRAGSAVAWAVDLAKYVNNLTAQPMAVLASNFGVYGTISWLGYGSSLAAIEEAGGKINSDPGFIQRLGDSAGLFVPGSGTGALSRKIA